MSLLVKTESSLRNKKACCPALRLKAACGTRSVTTPKGAVMGVVSCTVQMRAMRVRLTLTLVARVVAPLLFPQSRKLWSASKLLIFSILVAAIPPSPMVIKLSLLTLLACFCSSAEASSRAMPATS